MSQLGVSERRACKVLGQARATHRHRPRIADDEEVLTQAIVRLAERFGRYGYRRITAMLKREGWRVNHKRVERIWLREGLQVPQKQPITGHLAEFLRGYIDAADDGQVWLFPSRLKKSRTGHVRWIEEPFRRVVTAANLDPKRVVRHTLRHTAITHLVQAGVDLPTVQRISGHKTLQMVVRYAHQNGEHIRSAMDKLDGRYRPREEGGNSGAITP